VFLQIAVRERELRYAFLLPVVYAVRHFVFGAGTLFGLFLLPCLENTGKEEEACGVDKQ
jgi:Na+-transporting NADH:ubiquinone oxidoreductase subunit NqrD